MWLNLLLRIILSYFYQKFINYFKWRKIKGLFAWNKSKSETKLLLMDFQKWFKLISKITNLKVIKILWNNMKNGMKLIFMEQSVKWNNK